jgi:hypothetical protein
VPRRESGLAGAIGGLLGGVLLLGGLLTARSLVRMIQGWLSAGQRDRTPQVDPQIVASGHEPPDPSVGGVITAGVVVVVMAGLAVALVTWFQTMELGRPLSLEAPPGLATPAVPPPPPEPRLEEVPGEQLREVRAAEDQILNSTGWVDRQAGVAHIPIDRAIDLLEQQGLPARSPDEAAAFRDPASGLPSSASSARVPAGREP